MRKFAAAALVAALAGLAPALFGQEVAQVNDRLYTDLELWQDRGLIGDLPPLRPFPIQLVVKLLNEVSARGTRADRTLAGEYLRAIEGSANAHLEVGALVRSSPGETYEQAGVSVVAQGAVTPILTYSGDLGVFGVSGPSSTALPTYVRPTQDFLNDSSVQPLGSSGLTPRLSMTSQLALGSDSLYFQTGVLQDSFGPFWGDNAVLSPDAPQSVDFSLTWRQGFFTYTQLLKDISATQNDGGGGPSPGKFLSLNSLDFYPASWLTLGIFESVVWGDGFDPRYLLPAPSVLYYAQGLVGWPGAEHFGLSAEARLPHAIKVDALLYQGDASFNDLVKLDFNTMDLFSAQGGLSWTPNLPFLTRLSLNYLLVSPYAYTHVYGGGTQADPTEINYENYTNDGENMGPSIDPNSDRLEIEALVRPAPFADVTLFGRIVRHGNASSYGGTTYGNGTVFDDGYVDGSPSFAPGYTGTSELFRFLSQPVLEQIFQIGAATSLRFETTFGEILGTVSYTFEFIANPVDASGNPQAGVSEANNYIEAGLTYRF